MPQCIGISHEGYKMEEQITMNVNVVLSFDVQAQRRFGRFDRKYIHSVIESCIHERQLEDLNNADNAASFTREKIPMAST